LASALGLRLEADASACSGVVDGVVVVVDGFALSGAAVRGTRVTAAIWPDAKIDFAPAGAVVPSDWDPASDEPSISHDEEQAVLRDRASACTQRCGFPGALDWLEPRLDRAVMACPSGWSFAVTHREVIARRARAETDES